MGIPAFYRWLTERYPLTIADVMEETPLYISGVSVPVDTSCPNPNGVEFDNLYLDMNGIIHPCFHPEGLPPPTTYEEVFAAVFKYIDRIFSIVRPRKLLFMAIDGVAPRAKMNQQRSRRFRAARDAACQALSIETNGGIVSESKEENLEQVTKLDSNVITPGTEFMDLLSSALRSYIGLRVKEKLGWRGIKVILSDANVAGEGEHKIMSYIRLQRNLPGFDPNTRHCLYGLDADLIMLALASHEIHFSILREDNGNASTGGKSFKEKQRVMKRQKLNGDSEEIGKFAEKIENHISGMKFQFFNVWILREYLAYDMRIPDTTLKVDLERVIDDFVFMCLFVGNDFLPHIPSLEISEGAIDLLMTVYKKEFARMGGYLTNSFEINLIRVEHFVQAVGSHESAIFRRRNQMQKEWEIRIQRQSKHQKPFHSSKSLFDDGVSESCKSSVKMGTAPLNQNQQNPQSMTIQQSNHFSFNDTSAVVDKIKLGDEGWKERFYAEKFETKSEDERDTIRRHAVFKYVEGICWVMRYYYEGVCSWQWFYPYHYAPFASDFYGCGQLEIHFTLGKPFKPFDQLMAVLPAARKLMMDASSPILDFYPTDFELDINGKRFSWQAICKLPFIEESRLVSEIAKVEHTLTDEERRRNRLGYDVLCVRVSHPLAVKVISLFECKDQPAPPTANIKYQIDPTISDGMNGCIYISEKPEWLMTTSDQVISVFYEYPPFHSHIPRLPEGAILPYKSVTKWNCLHAHQLWHEPAVSSSVSSKRQIPMSISGPQLAKLAHRLVSEYSSSKHLDIHRCAEHGFPLDADRMGERRTQVQPKKRKRDKCNKDCLDGRSKESQVGKGDFVPINNAENMESSTLRQQGGSSGDYVSAGVDEIKIVKSKKRKRSSKDREHKEGAEGAGTPDGVQKLERSAQEQRNSDHTPGGADGENDYKEAKSRESKSRKRKERNKKGNQNDGDAVRNKNAEKLGCTNHISKLQCCILQEQSGGDVHAGGDVALELKTEVKSKKRRKIEADGVVINNVEKLGSCFLMEQRGGDSTHANADGLNAPRNPVPSNNYQELEDAAMELKTELKSKKRKKFVADGILINNVEKLGGSSLMEQRGGDSNLTNVVGLGATRSPVPNNIDQEFEDSGLREQVEHFDHSGANEVEIKQEIKSKRKKRRSKKKQQIELIVPTNDPLNLQSDLPGKEGALDGNHIGVGGLEMKPEVNSKIIVPTNDPLNLHSGLPGNQGALDSNHIGAGGLGMKPEVNSQVTVPTNDPLNLQSGLPGKQGALDSIHIGVGGLEMKAEVKSKRKKRRSKKKRQIELIVPTNDPLNLQSGLPGNQGALDSNHIDAGGLEMKPEVNSKIIVPTNDPMNLQPGLPGKQGALDSNHIGVGGLEMKAEVKSKRKKRRSKKKRQIELIVPTNDPLNLQSGLTGNQGALDSNHIDAGGLGMKPEVNSKITVPTNDPLNLLSGLPGKQGALDSNHILVGGLEMKPEVNSKIIVPTNDPMNLQPGLPGKQGALDSNDIGVGGLEMKAEVKSKSKKRRSKKKRKIELIVPTNDPLNLQSGPPGEQGALDSNHIGVGGLEMKPEVNFRIIVPTNDPLNLHSGLPGKQGPLDSNQIVVGGLEIKPEVNSKITVPTNDPLNLQSGLTGNQGALDSNHIDAGGLGMKPEVNSKITVPTNDPLNLLSGLPGKQGALDSNHILVGGLEMKPEVNSKIIVPTNDPMNLQPGLPGKQRALDSNDIGLGGLEMKAEVKSKSKKRRSKKKRKIELIVPTNDPLNLQSGPPGEQGALDSNHIGVGGLEMKPEVNFRIIVPTNDPLNLHSGLPGKQGPLDSNQIVVGGLEIKPEVNSKIIVPTNDPLNLQSCLPGKQGTLESNHIGVGGLEMKPEVNSKIIVPTNDPLKLQSCIPGNQGSLDSNHIGVGGLEMKPEVNSKRKKRRSKKKRQIELIVPTNDPLNLKSGLPGILGTLDSNHIGGGGLGMKTDVTQEEEIQTRK